MNEVDDISEKSMEENLISSVHSVQVEPSWNAIWRNTSKTFMHNYLIKRNLVIREFDFFEHSIVFIY